MNYASNNTVVDILSLILFIVQIFGYILWARLSGIQSIDIENLINLRIMKNDFFILGNYNSIMVSSYDIVEQLEHLIFVNLLLKFFSFKLL